MICDAIQRLINYGITQNLITKADQFVVQNQLMEALQLTDWQLSGAETEPDASIDAILQPLVEYACSNGIIADTAASRDLFDTKLMGILTPMPHEMIAKFQERYQESPEAATDWYFDISQKLNYVRAGRIAKDKKWKYASEYGMLDITINRSKPEKDPRDIAAARNQKAAAYPKCQLCKENEGYAGRLDHPARENHRIIPITINGGEWGFQYSPYVYYNEHCIVFNGQHTPMKIERATFVKLFDFVKTFPHYFLGSNADLPIVGGSILSHDHFQGGHYTFAMEKAPIIEEFMVKGFEDVKAGIVKWPLSVIRLSCKDEKRIIDLADHILGCWRTYTDEDAFIFAETDGELHNTITPIARKRGDMFELDLALRNNITTEEHPLGVYHPHAKLHHIKKENIGLIEVMGLAVLPSRLKGEMEALADAIVNGKDIRADETLKKHADWVDEFTAAYEKQGINIDATNIDGILEQEVGKVFCQVLEDAGVFKCDEKGLEEFRRFIAVL